MKTEKTKNKIFKPHKVKKNLTVNKNKRPQAFTYTLNLRKGIQKERRKKDLKLSF
jgi:hypothetical protein